MRYRENGEKVLETPEDILEFLNTPVNFGISFEAATVDWTQYPLKSMRIVRDTAIELLATPLSLTDFTK
jgi:hypothetical protein